MANQIPRIEFTGADGLIELLRTIPDKQLLPAVNKGMRAVGSKTIRAARKHLKKNHGLDTGQLKKSLGVRKVLTIKKEGKVIMYLGPRGGFASVKIGWNRKTRKHDPFFIAHLVEFGHRIAIGRSGGSEKNVAFARLRRGVMKLGKGKTQAWTGGFVSGKPFLRPAVDANKNEFNKQMVTKIADVLKKAKASGK